MLFAHHHIVSTTHLQKIRLSIIKNIDKQKFEKQKKLLKYKRRKKMLINTRYRQGAFIDLCSPCGCNRFLGNWTFSNPCQICFPPPHCAPPPNCDFSFHCQPNCDFSCPCQPNFLPCSPPNPVCNIDNRAFYFFAGYLLSRCNGKNRKI